MGILINDECIMYLIYTTGALVTHTVKPPDEEANLSSYHNVYGEQDPPDNPVLFSCLCFLLTKIEGSK